MNFSDMQLSTVAGRWGYSHDGETYRGAYATELEAAQAGFDDADDDHLPSIFVGRYDDVEDPGRAFRLDSLFEDILELESWSFEFAADWPEATQFQRQDLQSRLGQALRDWIVDHGLRPKFGPVGNILSIHRKQLP